MSNRERRKLFFYITVSWLIFLLVFSLSCMTTQESARERAIREFDKMFVQEDHIDKNLFTGPIASTANTDYYIFQWYSKVPEPGSTIIEIEIPRTPGKEIGAFVRGPRSDPMYLTGTIEYSFGENMLNLIFDMPPDRKDLNLDQQKILFKNLDQFQLKDIANFVQIKRELMEYYFCMNCQYPDGLEELNLFNNDSHRSGCNVKPLDSLFIHDRYSRKYEYENLINYIILGSKGQNNIWDFDKAIMDSLYNDQERHIFIIGDDIIVKFKPIP